MKLAKTTLLTNSIKVHLIDFLNFTRKAVHLHKLNEYLKSEINLYISPVVTLAFSTVRPKETSAVNKDTNWNKVL